MKALVCEMCNSNDMVKQNGLFVCQNCGTKYSVEDAKKIMFEGTVDVSGSSVKIDTSKRIENLRILAFNSLFEKDYKNAEKYYNELIIELPLSWEAKYFPFYFGILNKFSPNRDHNDLVNHLDKSLKYIHYNESRENHFFIYFSIIRSLTLYFDVVHEQCGSITDRIDDLETENEFTLSYIIPAIEPMYKLADIIIKYKEDENSIQFCDYIGSYLMDFFDKGKDLYAEELESYYSRASKIYTDNHEKVIAYRKEAKLKEMEEEINERKKPIIEEIKSLKNEIIDIDIEKRELMSKEIYLSKQISELENYIFRLKMKKSFHSIFDRNGRKKTQEEINTVKINLNNSKKELSKEQKRNSKQKILLQSQIDELNRKIKEKEEIIASFSIVDVNESPTDILDIIIIVFEMGGSDRPELTNLKNLIKQYLDSKGML